MIKNIKIWHAPERPQHQTAEDIFDTVRVIANQCGYSAGHLRKLLSLEKVDGVKVGDMWLTTIRAVKEYRFSIETKKCCGVEKRWWTNWMNLKPEREERDE